MCEISIDPSVKGVIYALHAGDGEVRYIGYTKQKPQKRLNDHRSEARNGSTLYSKRWMRKVGVDSVQMCILETFDEDSIGTIHAREAYHVELAKSLGYRLTNETPGGEGATACTDEIREKLSASKRGELNPNYGKTFSEEYRAKLSAAGKGKTLTEDHRQKISASHMGKKMSAEAIAKRSAAIKGRPSPNKGKPNPSAVLNMHNRWHVSRNLIKEGCIHCG